MKKYLLKFIANFIPIKSLLETINVFIIRYGLVFTSLNINNPRLARDVFSKSVNLIRLAVPLSVITVMYSLDVVSKFETLTT